MAPIQYTPTVEFCSGKFFSNLSVSSQLYIHTNDTKEQKNLPRSLSKHIVAITIQTRQLESTNSSSSNIDSTCTSMSIHNQNHAIGSEASNPFRSQ
jgi:hypothetical protein